MKSDELTINCDGLCKKRKEIKDLNLLVLSKTNKLFICKECCKGIRELTCNDIEYY